MADISNLVQLLVGTLSQDNTQRQDAEALYKQAKSSEPDKLLVGLMAILAKEDVDESVRFQSAVLLRQLVSRTINSDFFFAKISAQARVEVAAELLRRFQVESNHKMQRKVGEVISQLASLACDEDNRGWLGAASGWPELLPMVKCLADPGTNNSARSCECAVRLLKDLVPTLKDQIVSAENQQQLGALLEKVLAQPDVKVRGAAFLLICEIVEDVTKDRWQPLTATVGVLLQVLSQMASANMEDDLQECLGALIQVTAVEPDFFKQQMASNLQPATFLSTLVKTREGVTEGIKGQALEWFVTYSVQRPKFLQKFPNFANLAVECCMELMLQVEDGEEELRAWIDRMDDEEGEEDADEAFHTGEEAIDRIVEALGIDTVGAGLITLIGRFAGESAWQAKHAALTAVKQTAEYVEEATARDDMAKLLLQHIDHPHPRVRYQALNAILQLADDHAPQFQESWHKIMMPSFLLKFDDPVERVASMAMSAFVSFGSELVNELMVGYSGQFMEKLVSRLQTTNHRMVREESITSIAVIAGAIESEFAQYYDGIMPMLKQLMANATNEKEQRLRGKAFECMSLLGIAVGKEKFFPDAKEVMAEMMKTPNASSELQREYISEASERICKCLKADFQLFLPYLLPGIFKSLTFEEDDAVEKGKSEEDDFFMLPNSEGKLVKVHSSRLEELQQSVQLLYTFCEQMEGAYFDFVRSTADALLPLLTLSEEVKVLMEDARGAALHTWAMLIKCTHQGAEERGLASDPTQKLFEQHLLRTVLQKAFSAMDEETDAETLKDVADGMAECLKESSPGTLTGEELMQLVQKVFVMVDQSFERSAKAEKEAQQSPPDEDDVDPDNDDEDSCRRSFEDVLGAVMKVAPKEFTGCLTECCRRLTEWLPVEKNLVLGLWLSCDLLKHLKELSEPVWPIVIPVVFQSLDNKNPDVKSAAAYAINLAAPMPKFAEVAPGAFRGLAQIASAPEPKKKREENARMAIDNAVSSLLTLAVSQAGSCPPEVAVWSIIVSKLPLKADDEEAVKVHRKVVELLLEQHTGLLGPDRAHLGKILSALAEVYGDEALITKETDEAVLKVFKSIPREQLSQLSGSFSEKQQKKIERMLLSATA